MKREGHPRWVPSSLTAVLTRSCLRVGVAHPKPPNSQGKIAAVVVGHQALAPLGDLARHLAGEFVVDGLEIGREPEAFARALGQLAAGDDDLLLVALGPVVTLFR